MGKAKLIGCKCHIGPDYAGATCCCRIAACSHTDGSPFSSCRSFPARFLRTGSFCLHTAVLALQKLVALPELRIVTVIAPDWQSMAGHLYPDLVVASAAKLGHGIGYEYAHDFPKHFSHQRYLPEELGETKFYRPSGNGYEKEIEKYLEWIHE